MSKCVRSVVAVSLAATVVVASATAVAIALTQAAGEVAGLATIDGKPVSNIVRLRNIDNGQLLGSSTANVSGEFSFTGLTPGNYIVEMVGSNGTVIGTSVVIPITPALMIVSNVTVGASAAAVAAASGASGAAVTGTAASASGLSSTVLVVSAVGATLGTTAIVAVADDASPSR